MEKFNITPSQQKLYNTLCDQLEQAETALSAEPITTKKLDAYNQAVARLRVLNTYVIRGLRERITSFTQDFYTKSGKMPKTLHIGQVLKKELEEATVEDLLDPNIVKLIQRDGVESLTRMFGVEVKFVSGETYLS